MKTELFKKWCNTCQNCNGFDEKKDNVIDVDCLVNEAETLDNSGKCDSYADIDAGEPASEIDEIDPTEKMQDDD